MLQIKFDLCNFDSVELVPIADVHIGSPLCQEGKFKEIVDYILEEPDDPKMARICLLNGDLTESVTRNSVGNVFEQTMTPSVQVATMVKYLLPLTETSDKYPQGKILSYCSGNHDSGRYKDTGISSAESIAVGLGLDGRFSTDGCYSFISLKKRSSSTERCLATVYNSHLTGSAGTIGGRANRVQKLSNAVYADLYVGSHVHTPLTFKEDIILPCVNGIPSLMHKTMTYCITGAFLNYGDYAERASYRPSTIATPKIYIKQARQKNSTNYIYTEVLL